MKAREIRQQYLDFFKARGHLQMPSASLIPVDALGNADNSTLFTGVRHAAVQALLYGRGHAAAYARRHRAEVRARQRH